MSLPWGSFLKSLGNKLNLINNVMYKIVKTSFSMTSRQFLLLVQFGYSSVWTKFNLPWSPKILGGLFYLFISVLYQKLQNVLGTKMSAVPSILSFLSRLSCFTFLFSSVKTEKSRNPRHWVVYKVSCPVLSVPLRGSHSSLRKNGRRWESPERTRIRLDSPETGGRPPFSEDRGLRWGSIHHVSTDHDRVFVFSFSEESIEKGTGPR